MKNAPLRTLIATVSLGAGIPSLAAAVTQTTQQPWPAERWATAAPAEQRLNAVPLNTLDSATRAGVYGYVDRTIIIRNGYAVLDATYTNDYREISRGRRSVIGCGTDACDGWSGPEGFNYFDPGTHPYYQGRQVHSMQSVTKSITSTLIGIALGRGEIQSLSSPLLSFLTEYNTSRVEERLKRATLEDLLTMRTGIEWHEGDRPLDMTNTTVQLEWSSDWVQFTLDQPMDADPGTKWAYNSGGSHTMSAVLKHSTGLTADKYAEQHLFGPIGITDYHWKKEPRGLPDSEGGLYLKAEDLARIGYLYLNDGMWNGRRILPEGWARAATTIRVQRVNASGAGYGYQWWRLDRGELEIWAGQGFGGQYLLILPQHNIVAVTTGWNIFPGRRQSILTGLINALAASLQPGGVNEP